MMNINFMSSIIKKNKQNIKRILIILICSVVIGVVLASAVAIFDYLRMGDDRGINLVDVSRVKAEGNVEQKDEEFHISKSGATIFIDFPEEIYINKLQYEYSVAEPLLNDSKIFITYSNIYGDENRKELSDNYFVFASRSVLNIKESVSKIEIVIPEENAELKISDFVVDNNFKWNPLVALVVSGIAFEVLYLFFYRKQNAQYPGIATSISLLVLGMCLLVLQPPYTSGWDEQIHVAHSYDLAVTGDEQGTPNAISYLTTNSAWFYLHPDINKPQEDNISIIRGFKYPKREEIVYKENIKRGTEYVGVLLLGSNFKPVWVGNRIKKNFLYKDKKASFWQTPTITPVAMSALAVTCWMIKNKDKGGIYFPDDINEYKEIIKFAEKYISKTIYKTISKEKMESSLDIKLNSLQLKDILK